MDKIRVVPKSVEPNAPHAFLERMNQPYNIPMAYAPGYGSYAPEIAFRRRSVPDDCELCGKRLSDPIHAASDQTADNENWPV
jgi:hypothetical protein